MDAQPTKRIGYFGRRFSMPNPAHCPDVPKEFQDWLEGQERDMPIPLADKLLTNVAFREIKRAAEIRTADPKPEPESEAGGKKKK